MKRGEKIAVLVSLASMLVNAYLVWRTIEIQHELLGLQEMTLNYESTIVPVGCSHHTVLEEAALSSEENTTVRATYQVYLNETLRMVTPHYGSITFKIHEFNLQDSRLLASEMKDENNVSFPEGPYKDVVSSGLTQNTAQLHLEAIVYLDLEAIPPETETILLASLKLEVELYDLQAKTQAATEHFEAPFKLSVKKPDLLTKLAE